MSLRQRHQSGWRHSRSRWRSHPRRPARGAQQLEMYTLEGSAGTIAKAAGGVELAGVAPDGVGDQGRRRADAARSARSWPPRGVKVTLKRNKKGQTVTEQAAAQAAGGFNVWRSWDEPGGIRDELLRRRRATTRSWSSSRCSGARIRAAS